MLGIGQWMISPNAFGFVRRFVNIILTMLHPNAHTIYLLPYYFTIRLEGPVKFSDIASLQIQIGKVELSFASRHLPLKPAIHPVTCVKHICLESLLVFEPHHGFLGGVIRAVIRLTEWVLPISTCW